MWWNPPWSDEVSTNIGAKFLRLIDKLFPKNHILYKIFNRNCLKVSYRTTPNLAKHISAHNSKILNNSKPVVPLRTRNCRQECPLGGLCLEKNIIYQATVKEKISGNEETYIGRTSTTFKERFNNHKASFNSRHLINNCELGKHIWMLKDRNIEIDNITWKILG